MKTLSDDQAEKVHQYEVCPHCGSSLEEHDFPSNVSYEGMNIKFDCNKCRKTFTVEYKLVEVIEE